MRPGVALAILFAVIAVGLIQWQQTGQFLFFQIGTGSGTAAGGEDDAIETFDDALLLSWASDPERIARGESRYIAFCGACHAADLSATIDGAPLPALSLVDGEWKYGARPSEIHALITNGTPADSPGHNGLKMMPFGQILKPAQIAEIVAYILSENRADFGIQ